MISAALALAESWDAQLSSFDPWDGGPLQPEQEQLLFRVHARLSHWLQDLEGEALTPEREEADARRAGVRYLEVLRHTVRTTLFKANQGLVRKEAWAALGRARTAGRKMTTMDLDDLVQEGEIGLATSIDQFDGDRGVRFSTFAVRVIRRQIDRAIVAKEPLVYLPEHALQSLRRIRSFVRRFRLDHGFVPSHEQIVAATGVSLETLEAIYAVGRRVSEEPSDEGEREPACERISDPNAIDALRALVSSEVKHVVDESLRALDDLEREVLHDRFGLGGRPEASQKEIARRMGLSQQRIVQIEARALLKILIAARLQGVEAQGTGALRSSLQALARYGVAERDGLLLLQRWLSSSDRFRVPRYVRQRLEHLESLGMPPRDVGRMLLDDPQTINISVAARWQKVHWKNAH